MGGEAPQFVSVWPSVSHAAWVMWRDGEPFKAGRCSRPWSSPEAVLWFEDEAINELQEWGSERLALIVDETPPAVSGLGLHPDDGFNLPFSTIQIEVVRSWNRQAVVSLAELRGLKVIRIWPRTWMEALRLGPMPHGAEDTLRAVEIADGRPKGCNDGEHTTAMAVCLGEAWGMSGYRTPDAAGITRAYRL